MGMKERKATKRSVQTLNAGINIHLNNKEEKVGDG